MPENKILYTVHIYIQEAVAVEWYAWMLQAHIPAVMRTRCFQGTQLSALLEPVKVGYKGYIIQYNTTKEQLAVYQANFATALQREHSERYAGQFFASRFISCLL